MILERAIFPIKPGSAKEFAAAFALARPHIEAARGFRKLEIRQGIESPDSFILLVWWDSVDDHMKGFRESDAFGEFRAIGIGSQRAFIWGRCSPAHPRWSITKRRCKRLAEDLKRLPWPPAFCLWESLAAPGSWARAAAPRRRE